jgi:hypothetical protein
MKFSLFFIIYLFSITLSAQINYYVNLNSSLGGNGTLNSPFNSIQNAVNSSINNTHTIIHVFGGVYNENIWITKSGIPNGYFTIKPYQSQKVILDGTNQNSKEALIIQSASFVRIEGLIIQNYKANFAKGIGVYCENGNVSNIEIVGNEIKNIDVDSTLSSSNPIVSFGHSTQNNTYSISNILIANNKIHHCDTGFSEAIQINYNTNNFDVRNNEVFEITNIGIVAAGYHNGIIKRASNGRIWKNKVYKCNSPHAPAAGIYVDGARNVIIEQNLSYENQVGIQVGCENVDFESAEVFVRNNLIFNNSSHGLGIGGILENNHGIVDNSYFTNNTLFNNNTVFNADFGEIYFTKAKNCIIKNNIVSGKKHFVAVMIKIQYPDWYNNGNSFNHNLYFSDSPNNSTELVFKWGEGALWNFSTYQNQTGKEGNSFVNDPQFVNANLPYPELHIKNSINNGVDRGDPLLMEYIVGSFDFDGNIRANVFLDIGAYEYYSCPQNTIIFGNIDGNAIMKGEKIIANNTVNSSNNFYISNSMIELNPGFNTTSNTVFLGKIEPCN